MILVNIKKYIFVAFAFCGVQVLAMEQPPVIAMTDEETLTIEKADIFTACANGDLKRVQELIKSGVSVESKYHKPFSGLKGCTPLMIAAYQGHLLIVFELIKAGTNIHSTVTAQGGGSLDALGIAVIGNKPLVVQLLLHYGAHINREIDYLSVTPIRNAIYCGHADLCTLLVLYDADILSGSDGNYMGLSWPIIYNNKKCLKSIICNSLFLPSQEYSVKNNYTAKARNVVAQLPFCSGLKPATSAQRVKEFLLCSYRMKLSRDLRELMLLALPEDMVCVLSNWLARKKRIPSFAVNLMSDACYQATTDRLIPALEQSLKNDLPRILARKNAGGAGMQKANASIVPLLDPTKFEENYGKELRANIRARLANPYQYMNQLLALENKSTTK